MNATAALPVAESWRTRFAERGHAIVRGVLPAAAVGAAADSFRSYVAERHLGLNGFERSLGASATRAVFSLADAPEPVRAFVCSPILGRIAARALEVPAVRVLHFNGFYKPGGGMATPWHQDMGYIPLACTAVVTLWLPLVPVTADMGPLMFASGSHQDGEIDLAGVEARYPVAVNPPMLPGDVSLHGGWTAHRSASNRSDRTREAVAISYFPDGARIRSAADGPPMMASLLAEALPGLAPRALARGAAVPLVYRAQSDPELQWDERS